MIVQEINLYQDVSVKQPLWLSLHGRLLVSGTLATGLLLVSLLTYVQSTMLSDELAKLEAESSRAQEQITEFSARHPRKQPSRLLVQGIKKEADERRMLRGVLDTLEESEQSNTDGFSGYLGALARQRVEGLWLTSLTFDHGGQFVRLSGNVLEPELVPRFFQNLSKEDTFAGREFEDLAMARPNHDEDDEPLWIEFTTRTFAAGSDK